MNKTKDIPLYYQAPSDEIFEEVKKSVLKVWETVGREESYYLKKKSNIDPITNIRDNMMYMIAGFSDDNIMELSYILSDDAKEAIKGRLISVASPVYIYFAI